MERQPREGSALADDIVPGSDEVTEHSESAPHPFEVRSQHELEPRATQSFCQRAPPSLEGVAEEVDEEHDDSDILIHQFVREAACERVLVKQLKQIWNEIQTGSANEAAFKEAVGDALAKALAEHARKESERRMAKSRAAASALEQTAGSAGKFDIPEAAFGGEVDFHAGLENLGLPHPNIVQAMYREFCEEQDSMDVFTAWNSGENKTFAKKEWDFVVQPFQPGSVCAEESPRQWRPAHDYSGNRFPIRFQVFLHVVSATVREESSLRALGKQAKGDIKFGDYKAAHTRDQQDPLWLHREEVDKVQVVVMRFVKAQIRGRSLIEAFDSACERGIPCRKIEGVAANKLARDISTAAGSVLKEKDGPSSTCTMNDLTAALQGIASPEEIGALVDHFHALLAKQCMTAGECFGIRAYTGPAYVKFGGSLRGTSKEDLKGNSYINSIFATGSALHKISGASAIPEGRKLYRGMAGVRLPLKFQAANGSGSKGGVDYSFMSTTTKRDIALSYINASKRRPILFEYDVGSIDRGASISFMSQYPGEEEVLIPPRSYVEIVGAPYTETVAKDGAEMRVMIYPAGVNCNLKGQTIEQLLERRKHELQGMRKYIQNDCERDWVLIKESLGEDANRLFKAGDDKWEKDFDTQREREEKSMDELFERIARAPAPKFNDDSIYKVGRRNTLANLAFVHIGTA